MLCNNQHYNFMLNRNISDFDGLSKYTHREDGCQRTGECLTVFIIGAVGSGPTLLVLLTQKSELHIVIMITLKIGL